jgi:hypothetical protein
LENRFMRNPWANIALLFFLSLQLVTGFWGLVSGSQSFRWVLWLHGIGGYAVAVLLFWKGAILLDVFQRRWSRGLSRLAFVVLTLLLLVILGTGLVWTLSGPKYLWGFSLITIHTVLTIGLLVLLIWHTLARRFIFRIPLARDRRAALRLAGSGLAGLTLWGIADLTKAALNLPGTHRRFTGSYETGSLSGVFPSVSWLLDNPPPVDLQHWRLVVDGTVAQPLELTYAQLEQLAGRDVEATIDCTGGWYSTQAWSGIPIERLLDMAGVQESARSITFVAVSGYGRRFSVAEARSYLLATQVAGQPLSHGHGFPLRLVAPGRRGFEWVKWVTHLRVNETSKLWQPPLPLQ